MEKIGVIGAGIMGSGIAQVAAQSGFHVSMVDAEEKFIRRAFGSIEGGLGRFVEAGKITNDQKDEIIERIEGTVDLKEAMELKKRVFRDIDDILS